MSTWALIRTYRHRLPRGHLHGRVEHVVSGISEPFTSLEGLAAFMARYAAAGVSADKEPEGS